VSNRQTDKGCAWHNGERNGKPPVECGRALADHSFCRTHQERAEVIAEIAVRKWPMLTVRKKSTEVHMAAYMVHGACRTLDGKVLLGGALAA